MVILDQPINYFKNLGVINLGNLDKIITFLKNVQLNLYKVKRINIRDPLDIDLNFDRGDYMSVTRYGPHNNSQYIFTGENLQYLFDDWHSIILQIEHKSNTKLKDIYPRIIYIDTHTYRHIDNRDAALNVGLWNVETATTCFWDERKIASYFNMDVGEAIVMNTKISHSVILDDSNHYMEPRAILTFDILDKYEDVHPK